jgi:carbonic anhydrase/acetyltransferase-like protein (isoleucine patch superfamily)
LNAPQVDPSAFVAAGAILQGAVTIGSQAVVMFGAVLRAEEDEIVVGEATNVQDNVVVHCDAGFPVRIGARTTIGHTAVVHGATIGDGCLVGIGALALNGSTLGEGAWLAAGSVLPEGKTVPPWTLAVGAPARALRQLTDAEIERQRDGVRTYLRLGEMYRRTP